VQDRRLRRDPAPWIAAFIATIAGLINLASIVWPSFEDSRPVQTLLPFLASIAPSRPTAVAVNAAVGAGLLILAGGLRRSLRWAWLFTLALLVGGVAAHFLARGEAGQAVLEAAFAGWLAGKSRSFRARRGPRDRRIFVVPALELLAVTALYGFLGLLVNSDDFVRERGIFGSLGEVGRMAVGFGTSRPLPGTFGRVFPGSVAALFLAGCVVIVIRAVAPRRVVTAPPPTPAELRASEDSLAYFSTRDDRVTVRVRDGLISYGAAGTVALAAGDPLGPREAWPAVVDGFLAQAAETGRVPAVLGCSRTASRVYRAAGMRTIYLGDEATLHLASFDIGSPARKGAREGWHRGVREGMTASLVRSRDLPEDQRNELKGLSERWLGDTEERGFSMALSRLFDLRDESTWFLIARDGSGRAVGFIHLVPWASDGAGVDAMRRDRDAPNVINDFLIVEATRLLPPKGIVRLSLNFAFLRGLVAAAERGDVPWWTRMEGRVLERLSGTFQIESLYRFNAKFDPRWFRRYACVQSITDVPRVALAMGRAEGQLVMPWDRWRTREAVEPPEPPDEGITSTHPSLPRLPEEETPTPPLPLVETQPEPEPSSTHHVTEILSCAEHLDPGTCGGEDVSIVVTVVARRIMGGLSFLVVRAEDEQFQVILERGRLGAERYADAVDARVGDRVVVQGLPARSKRGEPSLMAVRLTSLQADVTPRPAGATA
jgi:lysyl-tRNA synthetase class 2